MECVGGPQLDANRHLISMCLSKGVFMKVNDFFHYREEVTQNGIFLTFSGVLIHSFMIKLSDMLKTKMALFNVDKNVEMKIFSTVIEQTQNIIFYSAERIPVPSMGNEMMGVGTITVGMEDGHYFVICGNMINNEKVEKLRVKLTTIQEMDQEELKQYYKEQRRLTPDSDSKGAGLGFIEMARKASKGIEFAFRKLDDKNSFFTLKTTI